MCLICVDIQKEKMTADEGYRALGEMCETLDPVHVNEVEDLLFEKMLAELMLVQEDNDTEYPGVDYFVFSD
jgi:hypothetical protein